MNFYKIKNRETMVCFSTEEVFTEKNDVIKYAVDCQIIPAVKDFSEVEKISEDDYVDYLVGKLYNIFLEEYTQFENKLSKMSISEICDEWADISARKNVMALLDGGYNGWVDYEAIETWLSKSTDAVEMICKAVNDQDFSDENERIYSILNREGICD